MTVPILRITFWKIPLKVLRISSQLRFKVTDCLQNKITYNYQFNFEKLRDYLHIRLYVVVVLNFLLGIIAIGNPLVSSKSQYNFLYCFHRQFLEHWHFQLWSVIRLEVPLAFQETSHFNKTFVFFPHIVGQNQILKHNLGLSVQCKSQLCYAESVITRGLETPKITFSRRVLTVPSRTPS